MYFKVTYRTPQGQFWLYAWDYIENRKSKRFIINPTGRKTIKNIDINIAIFCNKHNISKEGNTNEKVCCKTAKNKKNSSCFLFFEKTWYIKYELTTQRQAVRLPSPSRTSSSEMLERLKKPQKSFLAD